MMHLTVTFSYTSQMYFDQSHLASLPSLVFQRDESSFKFLFVDAQCFSTQFVEGLVCYPCVF